MLVVVIEPGIVGLVLAAGAGSRMGGPKALVREPDGRPWLAIACGLLGDAGCEPVVAVLGAEAERARRLVPAGAVAALADDWAEGLSASLRRGLRAAEDTEADAVLVTLVDLPDLPAEAVRRVLAAAAGRRSLARAVYGGRPGHPVLIGRSHWGPLAARLAGDSGAQRYLGERSALEVECGDLGDGADVDRPRR